jgi:hypothetical protein
LYTSNALKQAFITIKEVFWYDHRMNHVYDQIERPRGYYACLIVMLSPIIAILLIPVVIFGLDQLPYAILMIAFVLFPILGCGLPLRGRPLFQSSYHGTPFDEEVMDISDDEKII